MSHPTTPNDSTPTRLCTSAGLFIDDIEALRVSSTPLNSDFIETDTDTDIDIEDRLNPHDRIAKRRRTAYNNVSMDMYTLTITLRLAKSVLPLAVKACCPEFDEEAHTLKDHKTDPEHVNIEPLTFNSDIKGTYPKLELGKINRDSVEVLKSVVTSVKSWLDEHEDEKAMAPKLTMYGKGNGLWRYEPGVFDGAIYLKHLSDVEEAILRFLKETEEEEDTYIQSYFTKADEIITEAQVEEREYCCDTDFPTVSTELWVHNWDKVIKMRNNGAVSSV